MEKIRDIKSVAITGATGAIGIALCNLLIENDIKVYAICNPSSKRLSVIPSEVNIIECDISNYDNLVSLDEKIDAFFHFAWKKTVGEGRNDMKAQLDNVRYTIDAINLAKRLGSKVFIGAGSQAEYGIANTTLTASTPCNPVNGYGIAKYSAGKMCSIESRKLNIDFIWTRILSVFGPCDGENAMISNLIKKLLNNEVPELTSAEQLWEYIYSKDTARALLLLAQKGFDNKTYIISTGESKPLKEYIKIVRDNINPDSELGFGKIEQNVLLNLKSDISDLKKDVGFVPKTSFEEGIKETIKWQSEKKD